jgi:hypothetical protein
MLKSEVTNAPQGCTCEMTELPNLVNSSVKGYTESKTCDICKAIYAQQAIEHAARQAEEQERREKEELVQAKMRKLAEDELKKEGKLDADGKVVK